MAGGTMSVYLANQILSLGNLEFGHGGVNQFPLDVWSYVQCGATFFHGFRED
jgi:hypothetical protein